MRARRPRSAPDRAVTESLVRLAAGHPAPCEELEAQPSDVEELLLTSAWQQRVMGLLVLAAATPNRAAGLSPALLERLRAIRLAALAQTMRWEAELARLAELLDGVGIAWAVVKGPALAAQAYARPEERVWGDIDVLVDPRRFDAALAALESSGAELLDRNWALIRSSGRGELGVRLWHGAPLDLHWHLLNTPRLRRSFRLPTDELLAGRTQVELASGLAVATLPLAESLIYVALHACLAGGHRLGWLVDVSRLAARVEDWDEVWGLARRRRATLPLAVLLQRAATLRGPGTTVETGALARAPRSAWAVALALDARVRSPALLAGRGHTGAVLVSSTRASSAASLGALAGQLAREVAIPRLGLDRRDGLAASLRSSGGAAEDRNAYLAAVGRA